MTNQIKTGPIEVIPVDLAQIIPIIVEDYHEAQPQVALSPEQIKEIIINAIAPPLLDFEKEWTPERVWTLEGYNILFKVATQMDKFNNLHINDNNLSVLAARLYNHDLANKCSSLKILNWDALCLGAAKYADIKPLFLSNALHLKLFGLTMAYLATGGDSTYLKEVSVENITDLLKSFNAQFGWVPGQKSALGNVDLVAAYQLLKNASTHGKQPYSVDISETIDNLVISVHDKGDGIRDRSDNPFSVYKLDQIFYTFSSSEKGGLGLQVVKGIVALRGGYVEVITPTKENKKLIYCPSINGSPIISFEEVYSPPEGTTFRLHLPKLSFVSKPEY